MTGNHEHWSGSGAFLEKMDILKECGVHRLSGVCETVSVRGTAINLCGVDDPEASFTASADSARDTVSFLQQIDQVRKASEMGIIRFCFPTVRNFLSFTPRKALI